MNAVTQVLTGNIKHYYQIANHRLDLTTRHQNFNRAVIITFSRHY